MNVLKTSYLSVFTLLFSLNIANAHYYDTLPKGVRLFAYRLVQTEKIKSSFDDSGKKSSFQFNIDANTDTLSGVNDTLDLIFSTIAKNSGGSYSLGSYQISGESQVKVQGTGFGYGITNKITAFVSIPHYQAQTNISFKRTKAGNENSVADKINSNNQSDSSTALAQIVSAAGTINGGTTLGEITQGILVNGLGYKPVGNWTGQGLGDMELGALYRLHKSSNYGLATGAGIVVPTGRTDDPDILQDTGFGDGQFDIYAEFGGGRHLRRNWFLNASTRYTYQMAGKREFRIPYGSGLITSRKEDIRFKLGNELKFTADTEYSINDWVSLMFGYELTMQEKSRFYSSDAGANSYMAENTDKTQHQFFASAELSSITPFLKKKFLLPAKIQFTYRSTIAGRNTPKVDRFELDFRMMF